MRNPESVGHEGLNGYPPFGGHGGQEEQGGQLWQGGHMLNVDICPRQYHPLAQQQLLCRSANSRCSILLLWSHSRNKYLLIHEARTQMKKRIPQKIAINRGILSLKS
jgi:hypothetical protein